MPDTFVPMREWLVRDVVACDERASEPLIEVESDEFEAVEAPDDVELAVSEARRFRAALADALEMCVEELVRDIASDVLARELQLAPSDVRAIAERAIERYGDETVCIRANPADADALATAGLIVVHDERLRSGDVLLETRHGSIDASLGVRLERVLTKRAP